MRPRLWWSSETCGSGISNGVVLDRSLFAACDVKLNSSEISEIVSDI